MVVSTTSLATAQRSSAQNTTMQQERWGMRGQGSDFKDAHVQLRAMQMPSCLKFVEDLQFFGIPTAAL